MNIITSDLNDLKVVDEAVILFEKVSGGILSRTFKCKIIGFGSWRDKEDWPLPYLRSVSEIKVFGVFIMNSVRAMVTRNWEFRCQKLQNVLVAWSSRFLESIFQRIEVVNTFALSRVFYIASILPLPKNITLRMEKSIGKFLWTCSGKVLRVSLREVKLPKLRGGAGLLCVESMAKCLRISQLLRLLRDGDDKTLHHIDYWMGEMLVDFNEEFGSCRQRQSIPSFFMSLADLVTEARISETITVNNWKIVTNKLLYRQIISGFPQTKVEDDIGRSLSEVWRKIWQPCITSSTREILYLSMHHKIPSRERLFRIGLANDPYCVFCFENSGALTCDREHMFCTCEKVAAVWAEIKTVLVSLIPAGTSSLSNMQLLTLDLPKFDEEKTYVWILGNYMELVWKLVHLQGVYLGKGKVFGYLKFKYKAEQLGARSSMKKISVLSF